MAASLMLAIETAGSACSAAVLRGAAVLACDRRAMRHGHAEALLPMIDRVTEAAGLAPAALEIVAAAAGPGGFTGIRVGLAAAHGIALAAGARLIGVSSFAAVAASVLAEGARGCGVLLVALDSRRVDLYVQAFAAESGMPLWAPDSLLPERLAEHLGNAGEGGPVLVAGDAAEAAAAALSGRLDFELAQGSAPDALGVAAAALHQMHTAAAPGPVRPLYLRPPDVTMPRR
jgi:tRNA threonylcarbamoyladenosine biosynthesis protein TsaB